MNFIIRIYSQSGTICSFVGSFLTAYSTELSEFSNYEIHHLINFIIFLFNLNRMQQGGDMAHNRKGQIDADI